MDIRNSLSAFILLFVCKRFWAQAAASYYTAGVVEFRPTVTVVNSSELLADQLKAYLDILASNAATDIDIIVFPEGTLNSQFNPTFVPSVNEQIIPCVTNKDNIYAEFLVQLSCAARRISKYLVINLKEKANCLSNAEDPRPCAASHLNIFNTNVAFDREGRVVSRYRKVHVYVNNENTTYEPEFAMFDTDFGVRFGQFICFDMLFYTPAQELVERFRITDFIFSTYFFSELPFLTAVQLQYGWAWANNVTLLAAGASYPQWGATGSGIFAGQFGDLVSVMVNENGERKLYKARVPKKDKNFVPETWGDTAQKPHVKTKLRLLKDPQIENYNSVLLQLKPNVTQFKQVLCYGDVCCAFKITARIINDPTEVDFRYRVGIFDGRRTYEKNEWSDIKVCALYTCANEQPSSCGEALLTDNVLFKSIEISGIFPGAKKFLIMPTIINDQLKPLKTTAIEWVKKPTNQHQVVNLKLLQEQANILTFGIYGQYYEKSKAAAAKSSQLFFTAFILLIWLGIK